MQSITLAQSVAAVRDRMARAARQSGRQPGDILLCAACKAQDSPVVRESASLDIDLFGENRAQELRAHLEDGAYAGKPVHFIGHLQTNKVRQVVGVAALIQSVDRENLLEAIAQEAEKRGIRQEILIEINLGLEDSKSGAAAEGLRPLLEQSSALSAVRVRGLMAIPPVTASGEAARPYFAALRELMEKANAWGILRERMDTLSMGMSGSYEQAILEGATLVRVGRDLYGERPARPSP